MILDSIISISDMLPLSVAIMEPKMAPKGIVQFSHGMAEHKERYYDFMSYLADQGYITVIHDHRGHGASVKEKQDLGYFYTEDISYIVNDLYQVTEYIKNKYKGLDVTLFSHSMGTLVSRNYLKSHDSAIKKLILCGPPTENPMISTAIFMARASKLFLGDKRPNGFLNKLAFAGYNKDYEINNQWLSSDINEVKKYNNDEFCGYIFTSNGFINLFKLLKEAYNKQDWNVKNPDLDIFVIAGKDDPVIQGEKAFSALISFLGEVGYNNIAFKLYEGKRHELLNEKGKNIIYEDVLSFIEKK